MIVQSTLIDKVERFDLNDINTKQINLQVHNLVNYKLIFTSKIGSVGVRTDRNTDIAVYRIFYKVNQ